MVKRTARLQGSKQKKDDEYYTLFQDIADEVSLYLPQLRGKRILCPCDWDESYNEEIVYKEEGYVLGRDLFASEGTIKNIDIAKTREKIEKRMDLVKCQFVYYLLNQAEEWGIRSISVSGYNPKTNEGVRFQDIADEVSLYLPQLRGKRILCPCDWDESYNEEIVYKEEGYVLGRDLFASEGTIKNIDIAKTREKIEKRMDLVKCQFVYYLLNQAEEWGIRSISVSGYNPKTNEGVRFQDIDYSYYDVIITNPPFSQFDEFIDLLIENGKEFLVIGPQTAPTEKSIIQHFQEGNIRIGYHYHLSGFNRPDGTTLPKQHNTPRSCMWYTNLQVDPQSKELTLTASYNDNPEKYPKYVNYDAIEVPSVAEIPNDYFEEMGVPITFMQKYNPKQFEIIGSSMQLGKPIKDFVEKDAIYEKGGIRFYLAQGDKHYRRLWDRMVIKRRKED